MLSGLFNLIQGGGITGGIVFLLCTAFQIWMFVDALRRGEYIWAVLILLFSVLTAVFYFLMVYRQAGPIGNPLAGFELPGAADRRQIARLTSEIHHLDKAPLHLPLADIYFSPGKLKEAETSYRAAYERDSKDEDTRAHLGACLMRENRAAEALPLL